MQEDVRRPPNCASRACDQKSRAINQFENTCQSGSIPVARCTFRAPVIRPKSSRRRRVSAKADVIALLTRFAVSRVSRKCSEV
jgi:hypothetical protein